MSIQQIYSPDRDFLAAIDSFTTTGNGTPVELMDRDVTLQISGATTAIAATLYRSTIDPGTDGSLGNWAPVDAAVSGNPSTGIPALVYLESYHAWWRVVVSSLTSSAAVVSVSGKATK